MSLRNQIFRLFQFQKGKLFRVTEMFEGKQTVIPDYKQNIVNKTW